MRLKQLADRGNQKSLRSCRPRRVFQQEKRSPNLREMDTRWPSEGERLTANLCPILVIHSHPQLFHKAPSRTPCPARVFAPSPAVNIFRLNRLSAPPQPVIRIVDIFF